MIEEPRCRACRSKIRDDIDRAIRAGRSDRELARQFSISRSAIGRHRAHVDELVVDTKAELAKATGLLDAFLAGSLDGPEDVLARGKQLLDTQIRFARALAPDNPKQASAIVSRAQSALVELHARAYKVIGTDAQPPALVDNSVRILAVLDRMGPEQLRALATGSDPVDLVTIDQEPTAIR